MEGGSEREIYQRLGLAFIEPELREDLGEIEQAESGAMPRLIERADLRGIVHCHTSYSDGVATVAEMAEAADRLGVEYMTITDHSPSAFYARGLEIDGQPHQPERPRVERDSPDAQAVCGRRRRLFDDLRLTCL